MNSLSRTFLCFGVLMILVTIIDISSAKTNDDTKFLKTRFAQAVSDQFSNDGDLQRSGPNCARTVGKYAARLGKDCAIEAAKGIVKICMTGKCPKNDGDDLSPSDKKNFDKCVDQHKGKCKKPL